jgi:uncharacterized protein
MLLVSIHDVTPAFESKVKKLWDLCFQSRVIPALLVVPDWHGQWPLERYPEFVGWIQARVMDGAELVLHGERHDEIGLPRGVSDAWKAWGRTDREGEFLTLDEPAALHRIVRGLSRLRDLGLEPAGFVPPAWLARGSGSLDRAVAAAGLAFTEDATSVHVFPSGEQVPSPVVRWSSRSPLRAWGSAAVAAARWRLQRGSRWPRIALHPQDLDHRVTARSLTRALEQWCGHHAAGRYADLRASLQPA